MNLWHLRNPEATENLPVSSDPKIVWKVFKEMEGICSMSPEDSLNIMLQVKLEKVNFPVSSFSKVQNVETREIGLKRVVCRREG